MLDGVLGEDHQLQIQHYETFINEVLRTKLKNCLESREKYAAEIQEYLELQKTLENIGELDCDPLKTKVDLGCGFFVQAEVPDVSKISIAVGFGFFLELTLLEALDFVPKKILLMSERLSLLEQESSNLNADIKLMLQTLGELQQIQSNKRP